MLYDILHSPDPDAFVMLFCPSHFSHVLSVAAAAERSVLQPLQRRNHCRKCRTATVAELMGSIDMHKNWDQMIYNLRCFEKICENEKWTEASTSITFWN
ncbi:hypothetical protein L596_001732 [Steinernema carpocapsae]|uniref:Uncharacterized protein n=1 Tax=Steinernema carpocapsae TaxID=34508 RepID=A0A4U8ULY3_STECR|nr:hypothetical protein L596_001732 [Steinernema carpocapsae]